jgi:succinate dehydrogenase / fumarate reductase cytochrome b subunit
MPSRPKYLNLAQIRLPLPGLVSILHRISGALLFIALPLLLCWWQRSLTSLETFTRLHEVLSYGIVKLVILALAWGYLHHLCAGLRYLALDLDIGVDLAPARASSKAVLAVSLALTALVGILLW